MNRTLPTLVLASVMAAAGALGALSPAVAHADDEGGACTTTDFKFDKVKAACKSGGRKAAKDLMKAAVKKAKDAGKDIKCKSCHEDMKSYKLKSNAVDDLKPWI